MYVHNLNLFDFHKYTNFKSCYLIGVFVLSLNNKTALSIAFSVDKNSFIYLNMEKIPLSKEELVIIKSRFQSYLKDISGKNSKEIYNTMYNTMIAEKETISLFTTVNENWESELETSKYGNFIYDIIEGVIEGIDFILLQSK